VGAPRRRKWPQQTIFRSFRQIEDGKKGGRVFTLKRMDRGGQISLPEQANPRYPHPLKKKAASTEEGAYHIRLRHNVKSPDTLKSWSPPRDVGFRFWAGYLWSSDTGRTSSHTDGSLRPEVGERGKDLRCVTDQYDPSLRRE